MALGTITKVAGPGTGDRLFVDTFSFLGDSAYPTGGTADFEGSIQTLTGDARTVVAVIPIETGKYKVRYDRTADKLKVYNNSAVATIATADGSDAATTQALANAIKAAINAAVGDGEEEVANASDLSGTTFKVLVISK